MPELPTGTVTLLFTDIEGSTKLLQTLGRERYVEALDAHRRLLREACMAHDGVEVEMQGDSFHFAFASARQAVDAAAAAQRAHASHPWPGEPLRVRIGLHTGEPARHGELFAGLDVHRAARIMGTAEGGQVLLSQTTCDLLAGEFKLRDLGERQLKDLSAPERIYALVVEDGKPVEPAEPVREERKLVAVLVAELVGLSASDPEDFQASLEPFQACAQKEIERFGGTVEKLVGEEVMALFGIPHAHDDDPERAVRAALAIRETIREDSDDLQVRIGITTGEALARLGVRTESGDLSAAGDVVNAAARLHAAAGADAILVDETTYRATERAIDYGEATPVQLKATAEPQPAWEVLAVRLGMDIRQLGPLVGRDRDLATLVAAVARVREEREPQLVTLVGVPGIGKSRLTFELFGALEQEPELFSWLQGRSLPYGEGVSFWALAEIVKTHAGILESDDAESSAAKLLDAIESQFADPIEIVWIERHLRPLVGLQTDQELAGSRDEAFGAWRRYLEALADQRPLVVVFEDLHFADEGLLDFVDHLVEWASGVPLLVLCTARPELLGRRAGWGGGKANSTTLSLAPLSDDETAQLVHALLEQPLLAAELQSTLISRAGGNPLYAEEFARLVGEGRQLEELPESVQGIIAARLDALPEDEKELIQDAAVLGKVFWLGALTQMAGHERGAAERGLHALERKEFLRRERSSSVEGESEYTFGHLLVRDVAYGQIPRARRADKHRLAAEWIEALGRPDDQAELVVHHYLAALELTRAARQPVEELETLARGALRDAGERAEALNAFVPAKGYFKAALELWPLEDAERPRLALRLREDTCDHRADRRRAAARGRRSPPRRRRPRDGGGGRWCCSPSSRCIGETAHTPTSFSIGGRTRSRCRRFAIEGARPQQPLALPDACRRVRGGDRARPPGARARRAARARRDPRPRARQRRRGAGEHGGRRRRRRPRAQHRDRARRELARVGARLHEPGPGVLGPRRPAPQLPGRGRGPDRSPAVRRHGNHARAASQHDGERVRCRPLGRRLAPRRRVHRRDRGGLAALLRGDSALHPRGDPARPRRHGGRARRRRTRARGRPRGPRVDLRPLARVLRGGAARARSGRGGQGRRPGSARAARRKTRPSLRAAGRF